MTTAREMHGIPGHLNVYVKDQDDIVTHYGKHARVVAFHPQHDGMMIRVDLLWGLREPTISEILDVARKDQYIRGKWKLRTRTPFTSGGVDRVEYWFDRA